jgi:hypothetical protein
MKVRMLNTIYDQRVDPGRPMAAGSTLEMEDRIARRYVELGHAEVWEPEPPPAPAPLPTEPVAIDPLLSSVHALGVSLPQVRGELRKAIAHGTKQDILHVLNRYRPKHGLKMTDLKKELQAAASDLLQRLS